MQVVGGFNKQTLQKVSKAPQGPQVIREPQLGLASQVSN